MSQLVETTTLSLSSVSSVMVVAQEPTKREVEIIQLPDLTTSINYPIHRNPHTNRISDESDDWFVEMAGLDEKQERKFRGLKAGWLCGTCYADCGPEELRVTNDFMSYLFKLDDWSDGYSPTGTKNSADIVMNTLYHPFTYHSDTTIGRVTTSFWVRMIKTAGPSCQQHFIQAMEMYFQAVLQQSIDRDAHVVPELDAYIALRRDTSGCKAGFALIEYAAGIDLPDEVVEHPVISDLCESTNDAVTWANDILSYNIEQSRGDTHNMVVVVMETMCLPRQAAIDYVAGLVHKTVDRFESARAQVPSWGPEIDLQVQKYIQGLQDWIVANVHWSFDTERYFGKNGHTVKETLQVPLFTTYISADV